MTSSGARPAFSRSRPPPLPITSRSSFHVPVAAPVFAPPPIPPPIPAGHRTSIPSTTRLAPPSPTLMPPSPTLLGDPNSPYAYRSHSAAGCTSPCPPSPTPEFPLLDSDRDGKRMSPLTLDREGARSSLSEQHKEKEAQDKAASFAAPRRGGCDCSGDRLVLIGIVVVLLVVIAVLIGALAGAGVLSKHSGAAASSSQAAVSISPPLSSSGGAEQGSSGAAIPLHSESSGPAQGGGSPASSAPAVPAAPPALSLFNDSVPVWPQLIPRALGARTFYISQSTGSDSNSGLSPAAAWQSLAPFQSLLGQQQYSLKIQPQDELLLCNGDRFWNTQLLVWTYTLGAPGQPVTIGNWSCRPNAVSPYTQAPYPVPLLSGASPLPQSTGVIGWQPVSWTFKNGTTSSSAVLAYNLKQLATLGGGFLSGAGVPVGVWVGGVDYFSARHPNLPDPLTRSGRSVEEFMNMDVFYVGDSPPVFNLSYGSYCQHLYWGLYGGNDAAFAAGPGTAGYYTGMTAVVHANTWEYNSISITSWTPPNYNCSYWYATYVLANGYNFSTSSPWLGTIPFAQSTSDPNFHTWRLPVLTSNNLGGNSMYADQYRDTSGRLRGWGPPIVFTNLPDFLDGPGEYWYNATSGVLYLIPLNASHAAALTASYSTAQVPFTLLAHSLAQVNLGLNSAAAVIQLPYQPPVIYSHTGYLGQQPQWLSIHHLEIAYTSAGIVLTVPVQSELHDIYFHHIVGTAFTSQGSTSANVAVWNCVFSNLSSSAMSTTSMASVYFVNNSVLNLCMDYQNSGGGCYALPLGGNYTLARENTLAYIGDSGVTYLGSGSVDWEHNVINDTCSVTWDAGAIFQSAGNTRYNAVYRTVASNLGGWQLSHSTLAHGLYGAGPVNFTGNLIVNATGTCWQTTAERGISFLNNICVNNQININPFPFPSAANMTAGGFVFGNNSVFINDVLFDSRTWPSDWPFIGPGQVPTIPSVGGIPPFAAYNDSLYCIGQVEGQVGGSLNASAQLLNSNLTAGGVQSVISQAQNFVTTWKQMTDQIPGGLQFGQSNCASLLESSMARLLAEMEQVRQQTELAAWTATLVSLGWYSQYELPVYPSTSCSAATTPLLPAATSAILLNVTLTTDHLPLPCTSSSELQLSPLGVYFPLAQSNLSLNYSFAQVMTAAFTVSTVIIPTAYSLPLVSAVVVQGVTSSGGSSWQLSFPPASVCANNSLYFSIWNDTRAGLCFLPPPLNAITNVSISFAPSTGAVAVLYNGSLVSSGSLSQMFVQRYLQAQTQTVCLGCNWAFQGYVSQLLLASGSYTQYPPAAVTPQLVAALPLQTNWADLVSGQNFVAGGNLGGSPSLSVVNTNRGPAWTVAGNNVKLNWQWTASFTLCSWFYLTSVTASAAAVFGSAGGSQPYLMSASSTGLLQLSISSTLTSYQVPGYIEGQWLHVCYAYDFTSTAASIYVNGSLTASAATPQVETWSVAEWLWLGSSTYSGAQQCVGVYNAALPAAWVNAVYSNQQTGVCGSLQYFSSTNM